MKESLSRRIILAALAALVSVSTPALATQNCAGTVSVSIRGASLHIVGDNEANCIKIEGSPADGQQISWSTQGGTLLQPDPLQLPDPTVIKRVRINLSGGSDRIDVTDVNLPQADWVVDGDDGDDFIGLSRSVLGGLRVRGQRGNDSIALSDLTVATGTRVRGGGREGRESDNLHIVGGVSGPLAVTGFESHAIPPLGCPMAEDTIEGRELIGLGALEIVTCSVNKDLDAEEDDFGIASVEALSLSSGDTFAYSLGWKTPFGHEAEPLETLAGVLEIRNQSTRMNDIGLKFSYTIPTYLWQAFAECHELLALACPDELNTWSDDGDPGSDAGDQTTDSDGPI